ncbi:GNAT family N-acetyltransferase [Ureibacillus chungkukjangi]|uniref:GNAT family acetyltransferase n=1 Tax=Ureibacillus chungkukjangi TaxID=1202712 RepID=A0A318U1Z8_9BACL|nr:GNAT family N-acetyltransferase [Ureibacillus chungkukjangi]PYF08405.1 GNAT family acetyltransferase [Ureibacillus chungkukjangi]
MKLYQATIEDLVETAHLFNLYRMFYKQESDLEGAMAYINDRLKYKDSVIFVAKDDEKMLGFTQLYPTFSSISMKRAWILNDLYVEAEARGQGVGEKLLNKAKEFSLETGAKSLSLSTAADNFTAQRLYEKQGYERDGEFYHYELDLTK